jgi:FAD/FMN-containing dehydrogenase
MSYEVLMKDFPVTHFQPEASEYKESVAAFYTDFESSLSPAIVVRPKTIDEVSRFIKLAASNGWQVAIKGAGNTPWSGAANIEGGVMIDMRDMLGISIRDNEKTVSVSAGERWGSVFSILQAKGLATAGGRVSRVGVVGLTLGGNTSPPFDTAYVLTNL